MFETWTPAVFSLMNSSSAIWRFVRPSATSPRTSRSRAVSPKLGAVVDRGRRRQTIAGACRLEVEPRPRRQRRDLLAERLGAEPVAVSIALRSARPPGRSPRAAGAPPPRASARTRPDRAMQPSQAVRRRQTLPGSERDGAGRLGLAQPQPGLESEPNTGRC